MVFWRKRASGWMAIHLDQEHIDLVHIDRKAGGKPRISLCESYRKEGSDSDALMRLRRQFRLDKYRCTTLLSSPDYQMQQVEAPNVPANELKNAVRWRIKDLIDYPLDAATVDVLDIPVDRNAPGRNHQVYAVSARNEVIARCVQPFNDAGVPLTAIDVPDTAQRNVATLFESGNRGVALLVFYADEGLLTFTQGGELYLSRRIEISLTQLTQADEERRAQYFDRIALELQRSLDNFDRNYNYVPISRVLLGPLPANVGLADYLTPNLSVPVESVDLASVLQFPAVPELKQAARQAQLLAHIGAALRDETSLKAAA